MAKNAFAYLTQWYVFLAPREILKGWANILWFNLEYFSIFPLLKTLFSPWRRNMWSYGKGFNIGRYVEVLLGNLISRILGALMRVTIIAAGLFSQVLLFALGPFFPAGFSHPSRASGIPAISSFVLPTALACSVILEELRSNTANAQSKKPRGVYTKNPKRFTVCVGAAVVRS